MDQVELQILVEENGESWRRRCYEKVERLKAQELSCRNEDAPLQYSMDFELRKAIQYGDVDEFVDVLEQLSSKNKFVLSTIVNQVTPASDSLLHEAAYFGNTKIVELIAHHFPELVTSTNIKGDTPLHVAARAKRSDVIKFILSKYDAIMLRNTNKYGNTALHEAVYSKHVEGVKLLFEADPSMAYFLTNESHKSPLNLAILIANKEIVDILLKAPLPNLNTHPSNCIGNSPLHAAISQKNLDLMRMIVGEKSNVMYLRDEYGGTPLHYAAATGDLDSVIMLLKKPASSTALEMNKSGYLPIHLACKWGHVKVVQEFLKQEWADPRILLNGKGRNILHIAANNGRESVVKYLLRKGELKQHYLVNEKDNNGNTPLHLAAENIYPKILFWLTQEASIDLNITNNDGYTAKDIVRLKGNAQTTLFRQRLSSWVLEVAGGELSGKAKRMLDKNREKPKFEVIKDKVNTLMVVAVLIATVTFAAGFTVPGGIYSSDESNPNIRGKAVLGDTKMFKLFVASDTVAMYTSVFATFILVWAQLEYYTLTAMSLFIAMWMVGLALMTMNVAFMAALSLVVSHVSDGLATFILIFGILSSFLIFTFAILGIFPIGSRRLPTLLHQIRFLVIRFTASLFSTPVKIKPIKLESSKFDYFSINLTKQPSAKQHLQEDHHNF